MVLAEVLIEKESLNHKIKQMERYLFRMAFVSAEQTDKATKKLLELIDKHRSHLIMINKINNSIEVTIGESKVSLANAVLITQTMERKIELMNSLIDSCDSDSVLDIFVLIEQRDKLLEEYNLISNQLESLEWSTKVD
jgi:hypothetical protein